MSGRAALRAVPPAPPEAPMGPAPIPEVLLTIRQLAETLQASRSKIERDVELGLPCLDLGTHHPGRRQKRSLRFSLQDVLRWYSERSGGQR